MAIKNFAITASLLLASISSSFAAIGPGLRQHPKVQNLKRQTVYYPKPASGVQTITTPTNLTITYKEPGKAGVCETTEGVDSYSGYVNIAEDYHVFFWFFESRRDPVNDDFTLWLNGGPGSDSLIGLFEELGPCRVTPNLTSVLNPYSWTNVSNMLFLSQPVGVGFSNQGIINGSYTDYTGSLLNASVADPTGTYGELQPNNEGEIDTTDLAAAAAWEILQGFLVGLPKFANNDAKAPKNFNLWTESYGGHYGPSFFNHFYKQNQKIQNGTLDGYAFNFNTLGIGNGIIDERIQAEYYPEFAVNNTYGIKAYNDTVYSYARFATFMINGCYDQIDSCVAAAKGVPGGFVNGKLTDIASQFPAVAAVCTEAADMCRDNVEGLYYSYGGHGVYDIRHPYDDVTPPQYENDYLNLPEVQEALGVSLNYSSGSDIYYAFQQTGDFIYPNFLEDLKEIVNSGVRVALFYGDADYICNWFGGEAISLALNYTHAKEFKAAGYQPFMWNGEEFGEVREYGNFSFLRIYDAGHEVPYYQPGPALAMFDRAISGVDIAEGMTKVTANLTSTGNQNATHTAPAPTLPPTGTASSDAAAFAKWSSEIIASYDALDNSIVPLETATAGGY